ncbi:MAG: cupin domain-containing protein [Thiobacillus sp.]|nr:cupin domain-containing protein [Thiobacillus sp.]
MPDTPPPLAIVAADAPLRARPTNYPAPVAAMLAARLAGRQKRPLGDLFGLTNFGVNLTRLAPGAVSSLRHAHAKQDEFVYILDGCPTLVTNAGRTPLAPGMCAGFRAGSGDAHTLVNETDADVLYLEIGDRTSGDEVTYPDDDLAARFIDGQWTFSHKDGTPY